MMAFVAASNYSPVNVSAAGTTTLGIPRFADASGNGNGSYPLFSHANMRVNSGTITIQFDAGAVFTGIAGTNIVDGGTIAIPPGASNMIVVGSGTPAGSVVFGKMRP